MAEQNSTETTAAEQDSGNGEGQAPEQETTTETPDPKAGKTFDETYVKALRRESAQARTKLNEAETRLRALEDKDKSELQRLSERAADNERRATDAELRLTRFEVAADRGLEATAAQFLTGANREEIEARADELAALLEAKSKPSEPPNFDGGARTTPDPSQTPGQAHNDWLMQALGRK